MRTPYLIGLTGNIATGKSSVARLLEELGAEVIDSDQLVQELYQPGAPVTRRIVETWGEKMLAADGSIDRQRLGRLVFGDAEQLRRLEVIVHPAVGELRDRKLAAVRERVVVLEAIKLVEADQHRDCDALWVVICDFAVQLQRLTELRGLSQKEARARLEAQPPLEEKLQMATVVIDNSGSRDDLHRQVKQAWRQTVAPAIE